jgi:hypothetical protein
MKESAKGKYPALRIIAAWYKTVGYVVSVIFVIAGLVIAKDDGITGVVMLMGVGALVSFAVFVSIAEIIQLFLDSENNTRQSAEYLKQLVELQAPPSPTPKSEPAKPAPTAPPKSAIKPVARPRKAPASQAESIRSLIKHLHGDGLSPDEITEELKSEGLPTLTGEPEWTCAQVKAALEAAAK